MIQQADASEKIMRKVKGLRAQMQEGEMPILTLPAIWDNGESSHSVACDVIVTNQRVMGYYYKSFPREHLFLDALNLANLKQITWRDKEYEPIFRELLISDGQHKIYVRTPQQKCQQLYDTLKAATSRASTTKKSRIITVQDIEDSNSVSPEDTAKEGAATTSPQQQAIVYRHEKIRTTFERSTLAVLILFIGGILLELFGFIAWSASNDTAVGLPLIVAGFFAFVVSIFVRWQAQKKS